MKKENKITPLSEKIWSRRTVNLEDVKYKTNRLKERLKGKFNPIKQYWGSSINQAINQIFQEEIGEFK